MGVDDLVRRVRKVIEGGGLAADGLLGGDDAVELVEVDADRVAVLRLRGPCASCPATIAPLMTALERAIRAEVPEVRFVELVP
jgi:Fe-S cluster biogenesis protein NfuA